MIKINQHEIEKRGISFEVFWRDSVNGARLFLRSFNDLQSAIDHVNFFEYYCAIGFAPVNPIKMRKVPVQLRIDF